MFLKNALLLPVTEADRIVSILRKLGEQRETITRICHELLGYDWFEEKIPKCSTTSPNGNPEISQVSSSTTSSTATNS